MRDYSRLGFGPVATGERLDEVAAVLSGTGDQQWVGESDTHA